MTGIELVVSFAFKDWLRKKLNAKSHYLVNESEIKVKEFNERIFCATGLSTELKDALNIKTVFIYFILNCDGEVSVAWRDRGEWI